MGRLYGAIIVSVLFVLAQNHLQDLLKLAAGAVEGVLVLAAVLTSGRWLLWLRELLVLSMVYFPTGVAVEIAGPGVCGSCAPCAGPSPRLSVGCRCTAPAQPAPTRACASVCVFSNMSSIPDQRFR
jgi:branched-chain amino acid transport system permease protein